MWVFWMSDMKSYASTFVSFLLRKVGPKRIDRIILFGSVAKGESTKDSDVDIFIDTREKIKDRIEKVVKDFYKSREAAIFRSRGIDNEIAVKVGELKKWKELHRVITSTGIVLWGEFQAKKRPIGSKHEVVFHWDKIGKNRGAFLNKLYGFRVKDKEYKGLLEKLGGRRMGKSCIIIPHQHKEKIYELIKKYKVEAKTLEVFALE